MQSPEPSMDAIVQMSEISKANFNNLNHFANLTGITISGIYYYVAIGSLNIHTLDGGGVIWTPIKPTQAAKLLNCDSKKIARWCVTLHKRGLLSRDFGGAYKVANIQTWYQVSKLVSSGSVDAGLFAPGQNPALDSAIADASFLQTPEDAPVMRDRV